ncbi:YHYH protein [Tamlana sp. 62-3]|uniref:YHYH protein n=1 Tax=Neotamlana sargassicola TaxID=2883125 RepID=A0A9X1L410_9FLAO|nr:YHYH protein [Tamlana sargassicola]MCB4807712.1 YHYH protein [Tamlana sargassicola]
MKSNLIYSFAIASVFMLFNACSGASSSDDEGDETSEASTLVLNTSLFSSYSRTSEFELVDCTLSDGTETKCYKVSYTNSPEAWGPGCPEYVGEVGGLGVWDGNTNPGLRALDDELWADFATDGYDIINDDGSINIQIPAGGPGSGFIDAGSGINGSCLDANLNDLTITYYIPAYPVKTTRASTTTTLEYWGVSLDGFPYAEQPPGAASAVGAAIPALDPCGGHPQPDGPYHYHLIPQVVNHLLDQEGVTSVSCTNIEQTSSEVVGYARDGFAIYGYEDYDGSTPTDLDDCNGHTHVTDEFPEGIYHYHITNEDVPNILPCTYGATVASNSFSTYE